MPFFEGVGGRIYYREWLAEVAVANVLLIHGFGEHTGHYHRLAYALNSAHLNVWGLDHIGHGHSSGPRGMFGSVDDLTANAVTLLDRVTHHHPQRPIVVVGHSLGALTAAQVAFARPAVIRGLVMTGAPLHGLPEQATDVAEPVMSRDASYLDALANDPLGFDTVAAEPALWRALAAAGDTVRARLPELGIPTLLINGEHDVFATPDRARVFATTLSRGEAVAIPGGYHDIPNDVAHRHVAAHITRSIRLWCAAAP